MKLTPAIIALLVAAVLALGWQLREQIEVNRKLTAQIAERDAKRDAFELQAKCTERSEKVFHQLGWKEAEPVGGFSASYRAHYNATLNKCFTYLETSGHAPRTMSGSLYDPYSNRGYASFFASYTESGEVKLTTCKLTPPDGGAERECQSEDEFKAFVARYME